MNDASQLFEKHGPFINEIVNTLKSSLMTYIDNKKEIEDMKEWEVETILLTSLMTFNESFLAGLLYKSCMDKDEFFNSVEKVFKNILNILKKELTERENKDKH